MITFATHAPEIERLLGHTSLREDLSGDLGGARKLAQTRWSHTLLASDPSDAASLRNHARSTVALCLVAFMQGEMGTASDLASTLFHSLEDCTDPADIDLWCLAAHLGFHATFCQIQLFPGDTQAGCCDAPDSIISRLRSYMSETPASDIQGTGVTAFAMTLNALFWQKATKGERVTRLLVPVGNYSERKTAKSISDAVSLLDKAKRFEREVSQMQLTDIPQLPKTLISLELEALVARLYGVGRDRVVEEMTELLRKIQNERTMGDQERLGIEARCLMFIGDAYCTDIAPPETMNLFAMARDDGEFLPYNNLTSTANHDFKASLEYYSRATLLLDSNKSSAYQRLKGSLFLRRAHLACAQTSHFKRCGKGLELSLRAEALFRLAGDWFGQFTAGAHCAIYGIGSDGDYTWYLPRIQSIARWGAGIGSYSFAYGIGHLLCAVGRKWLAESGDHYKALACHKLAEALFRGLEAISSLVAVQRSILVFKMAYGSINCTDPGSNSTADRTLSRTAGDDEYIDEAFSRLDHLYRKAPSNSVQSVRAQQKTTDLAAVLVSHAIRHDRPGILLAVRRNLRRPLISGGLIRCWLDMPNGDFPYHAPNVLLRFGQLPEQLDIMYHLSHADHARRLEDAPARAKHIAVAEILAQQYASEPLVHCLLMRIIHRSRGDLLAASFVELQLVAGILEFQEEAEAAAAPETQQSETSPAEELQIWAKVATDFGYGRSAIFCVSEWSSARLLTAQSAFRRAVRARDFVLARKLFHVANDSELSFSYDLPRLDAWRQMGFQAIMMAAEGDVAARGKFDNALDLLQARRRSLPSSRAVIAFSTDPDVSLILLSAAFSTLTGAIANHSSNVIDFSSNGDSKADFVQAALLVDHTRAGIMHDLTGTPHSSSANSMDEFFSGNATVLNDIRTRLEDEAAYLDRKKSIVVDREAEDFLLVNFSDLDSKEHGGPPSDLAHFLDVANRLSSHHAEYERIVNGIPPKTVVLQYCYHRGILMAWSHDSTGLRGYRHSDLGETSLTSIAESLHHNLQSRIRGESASADIIEDNILRLSDILLSPFARELSDQVNYPKVMVVPFNALHAVPFHLLRHPVWKSPLGLSHAISQLMSLSLIPSIKTRLDSVESHPNRACEHVLVRGDEEVVRKWYHPARIADLLGPTILTGQNAQVAAVQQRLKSAHILHIYAHCRRNPTAPLESYIPMGNGQRFSVRHVLASPEVPIVVFMGCCSSVHDVVASGADELEGFCRAFASKGSTHVIGTLWDVDARICMAFSQYFFEALVQEATWDPSEAMRRARLQLTQLVPEPSLWATFVLHGTTAELPSCCRR